MQKWIQVRNATIIERSDNAINEICVSFFNHKLENDEAITVVGKDEDADVAAYSEGLIQSAAAKKHGV